MQNRLVWIPEQLTAEQERLKEDLSHRLVSPEVAPELRGYLEECFRRLLTTLDMIPNGEGRVLELGANPYFLTMALRRARKYQLELANFFGGRGEKTQTITDDRTGERQEFRFREFNIEEEEFPYPDAYFDGVLYCEILEHLVRDPIAVFAEIHRVLKPGGWLIVTTPNVARRHNLMRIKRGLNIYDPYSGYGPYGRHNREYTAAELDELLRKTGFAVEQLFTQDMHPCSPQSKVLALALGPASGFNLYALARRGPEFHWYYPDWLFRSGRPQRRVREAFVRVGLNDAVQLGDGWWDVEPWPDGPTRWTRADAEAFLCARGGEMRVRLLVSGGPLERGADPPLTLQIDAPGSEGTVASAAAPRGSWRWVEIPLASPLPAGEVKLTLHAATFVPATVGSKADARQLGVAVREVAAVR